MQHDGYVIIADPDAPRPLEFETLCCVHCGGHFRKVPGSGTKRGWCGCCAGVTCGKPACDPCAPLEKRIEELERRATFELRYGI